MRTSALATSACTTIDQRRGDRERRGQRRGVGRRESGRPEMREDAIAGLVSSGRRGRTMRREREAIGAGDLAARAEGSRSPRRRARARREARRDRAAPPRHAGLARFGAMKFSQKLEDPCVDRLRHARLEQPMRRARRDRRTRSSIAARASVAPRPPR
jgi:hypothetical protein